MWISIINEFETLNNRRLERAYKNHLNITIISRSGCLLRDLEETKMKTNCTAALTDVLFRTTDEERRVTVAKD